MTTQPLSRLGANYWPSYAGPFMWRDFRPSEVEADLRAIRGEGIGFIRAFLMWPEFMPTPDRVEPEMLERLGRFCELVEGSGLRLHLCLLVGHMSGQNWSPPWLSEPAHLYDEPAALHAQELMLRAVVREVSGFGCVECYDLANEAPHFAGPAGPDVVQRWTDRLYHVAKELDPARLVTLGDGAGYVLGQETGFAPGNPQDALSMHLYLSDTDPDRLIAGHGLAIGVGQALAGDREVWLQEFGAPHSVFGEDQVGAWAGAVALEARLQGAARICWWCAFDLDPALAGRSPYDHHPFELTFGLMRRDRTPRPVAAALRQALGADLPPLPEAGVLVPAHAIRRFPFSPDDRVLTWKALRNSYAALRRLGYRPRPVLEEQLTADRDPPALLVAPAVRRLLGPSWEALESYPGRVVSSYLHGAGGFHGAWTHRAEAFFGGVPRNRYGVPEPAPRRLEAGSFGLDLPDAGDPFTGTPLLLDPVTGEVRGRDEAGRPLWVGMARRDLLLYPLEALAETPEPVAGFYRACLGLTG